MLSDPYSKDTKTKNNGFSKPAEMSNGQEVDLDASVDEAHANRNNNNSKENRRTVKGIIQAIVHKQNEIGQRMIVPDEEKPKPCKISISLLISMHVEVMLLLLLHILLLLLREWS